VRIALRWTAVLAGIGLAGVALLLLYGIALVDSAVTASAASPSARLLSAPLTVRSGESWDPVVLRASLERQVSRRPPGRRDLESSWSSTATASWSQEAGEGLRPRCARPPPA
jgi:hypothetical protein